MSWVARVVTLFREGEGRLPKDLAEVFARKLPTGRSDDATKDLFAHPMTYVPAADGKGFAVGSLGRDGKAGGKGPDADVLSRVP